MRRLFALALFLAPIATAAQTPPKPRPAWEWSRDTINSVVNAVRAGRSLQPKAWPNGARVAVALSFDVDNESVALRFSEPTIGALSQGEYGARVALGRVLALLDRNAIPATFFIPAVSLQLHPEMAAQIKQSGRHEFGVHGWIHEMNTAVPGDVERELVRLADDAPLFNVQGANYASPREVAQVWIDEFDKAWEEGTMFLLTMHPHVSGHRSRIVALELLLAHMQAKGKVWFATHRAVAEYVKQQAGM